MRQAGLLLALLALVLKASAAPGYMLDGASGRLVVTLCSGASAGITLDLGGDGSDKHNGAAQDGACPFAVAAHVAAPPPAIALAPRLDAGWIAAPVAEIRTALSGQAARLPWARGPPLSI